MPITKSAKKALRQSQIRRVRNTKRATAYKTAIKDYKKAVLSKDPGKIKAFLSNVYKSLDKAAKVGTIKKNKASRLKSRLARKISKS